MLEINIIKPSCHLGSTRVEGYVNGCEFAVEFDTETKALDYITLNDEIVWADDHSLLEEPIKNPISAEILAEIKHMVATQVRTLRAGRY